jgi:hypothetical protein
MTLADAGRTVIVPQYDQNFDRRVDPAGEQKDAGIPQAIYMENVIPTVNGFQSVGWDARYPMPEPSTGVGNATARFAWVVDDAIIVLRTGTSGGYHDVLSTGFGINWRYHAGATPTYTIPFLPSIATARGTHYLSDNTDLFSFTVDSTTKQVTLTNVTGSVSGLTVSSIRNICSSFNYLIALHDDGTIYWSSTTTPTDFTASLVTGAGSETLGVDIGARFLVEHPAGFLIFGPKGVVFAQYTGNSRYPWKFTPVANAGGYTFPYQAWGNKSSVATYCIDDGNRVRIITDGSAQLVAPEISSFLERKTYHDVFDYTTNLFSPSDPFNLKKITYVLDRYLIVSIIEANTAQNAYAFVYDTLLQRYGKIKQHHYFVVANATTVTLLGLYDWNNIPKEYPYTLGFDVYNADYIFNGVLLLGKFQFVRDRFLQLEEINIESVKDVSSGGTQNFSLLLFPSFDGKNFSSPITLTPTITNSLIQAKTHKTAKSHSIMLKGAFEVNTLELHFRVAGER